MSTHSLADMVSDEQHATRCSAQYLRGNFGSNLWILDDNLTGIQLVFHVDGIEFTTLVDELDFGVF